MGVVLRIHLAKQCNRGRKSICDSPGTAGAAVLAALPTIGRADTYPSRNIRLVIPFAAGGSNDQMGRPWADKMGPLLGSVVIENIGGAGVVRLVFLQSRGLRLMVTPFCSATAATN